MKMMNVRDLCNYYADTFVSHDRYHIAHKVNTLSSISNILCCELRAGGIRYVLLPDYRVSHYNHVKKIKYHIMQDTINKKYIKEHFNYFYAKNKNNVNCMQICKKWHFALHLI